MYRADNTWQTYTAEDGLAHQSEIGGIPPTSIRAVAVDENTGDVWFGSEYGGASRRTEAGDWTTYRASDGLADDYVRDIAVDPATGDVWFGTFGGASRLSRDGKWTSFSGEEGLGSPYSFVEAVAVDPTTGDVWFGMEGGGASRLSPDGSLTNFTEADGLAENYVLDIAVDPTTGDVWFGTVYGGAGRLDKGGRWSTFLPADGLASRTVEGVTVDALSGDVWFLTPFGASKRTSAGEWSTLTADDGLLDGYTKSAAIDHGRESVWFGTLGGVSQRIKVTDGRTCDTAIAIGPGANVSATLPGPAAIMYYAFEPSSEFARIDVTVKDPDNILTVYTLRECSDAAGVGSGRHIGPGLVRRVMGAHRLSFDALMEVERYYVALSSKSDTPTFPIQAQLQLTESYVDREAIRAIIVTHLDRLKTLFGFPESELEMADLQRELVDLSAQRVMPALLVENVQLNTNEEVAAAYGEWALDPADAGRANAVATAIRDWIWQARAVLPNLDFVVLAGDDRVIPHGRVSIVPRGSLDSGWLTETEYMEDGAVASSSSVGSALLVADRPINHTRVG